MHTAPRSHHASPAPSIHPPRQPASHTHLVMQLPPAGKLLLVQRLVLRHLLPCLALEGLQLGHAGGALLLQLRLQLLGALQQLLQLHIQGMAWSLSVSEACARDEACLQSCAWCAVWHVAERLASGG